MLMPNTRARLRHAARMLLFIAAKIASMANQSVRYFFTSHAQAANSACARVAYALAFAIAGGSLLLSGAAFAAEETRADRAYVLHAEPVAIKFVDAQDKSFDLSDKSFAVGRVAKIQADFDALGRRFVAELEPHAQLNSIVQAHGGQAVALRGKLKGVNDSWIRLTQTASGLHGILWDGEQMIAIAPVGEVKTNDTSGEKTLIFRLSDTVIDADANSCAALASGDTESGAALFNSLKGELSAKSATVPPSLRLQVSALIDQQYVGRYASQAEAVDAVITRANNVDGIFTAQLGIDLEVGVVNVDPAMGDSTLYNATKPNDLLSAVSRARAANPSLYATGITHLFTGRDLDGSTVGISYVGAVCSQRYGVALSEARGRDTWYESLIAAHEIGHTFGAEHDGEGECASTPSTYLMASVIGNSDRFSQCSLERMQRQVPKATCLTALPQPDVSIAAQLGDYRTSVGNSFGWTMAIANLGSGPASGVRAQITIQPLLHVQSASVDGVGCNVAGGVIDCMIGSMPSQAMRVVTLTVLAHTEGNFVVQASVSSDADANPNNNGGAGAIVVESAQAGPAPEPEPVPAPATTTSGVNVAAAAPESQSGGGGALHIFVLLALLAVAQQRRRR